MASKKLASSSVSSLTNVFVVVESLVPKDSAANEGSAGKVLAVHASLEDAKVWAEKVADPPDDAK